MMYVDFSAGGKEYKLRLNTRGTVALEKRLGRNPLGLFEDENTLPTITDMVAVLHAALQPLQHGISVEDSYDIFDAYLDDGHTATDFIAVILDIYRASGLIKGTPDNKKDNATATATEKN